MNTVLQYNWSTSCSGERWIKCTILSLFTNARRCRAEGRASPGRRRPAAQKEGGPFKRPPIIGVDWSIKLDLNPQFGSSLKKWSRTRRSRSFLVGYFYSYIDPYFDPYPDLSAKRSKRSFRKGSTITDPKFATGLDLSDTPFRSLTPMPPVLIDVFSPN